jgi:hypothetical protein
MKKVYAPGSIGAVLPPIATTLPICFKISRRKEFTGENGQQLLRCAASRNANLRFKADANGVPRVIFNCWHRTASSGFPCRRTEHIARFAGCACLRTSCEFWDIRSKSYEHIRPLKRDAKAEQESSSRTADSVRNMLTHS